MHNPFLDSPFNLKREWKQLRSTLTSDLTDLEHLERVAKWWGKCPFSKQWLNYDDCTSWPDPWELITTKNLDYSAIALGMEYTLLLSVDERWTGDRVQICLATDIDKTMQHLVVIADSEWVLNFSYAKVVKLNSDLIIHDRYKYHNKIHERL